MSRKWPHTQTTLFERLTMKSDYQDRAERVKEEVRQSNKIDYKAACIGGGIVFAVFGMICFTAYKIAQLFAHN